MTSLTVISCDNCGACCRHMGTPPGYAIFFPPPDREMVGWARADPDWKHFLNMPEAVRQGLARYYDAMHRGEVADRTATNAPCLWYNAEARSCRHYAHRPLICRDFQVGGKGCLDWRRIHGIDARGASACLRPWDGKA